jgi:hypothetical protein
MFTFDLRSGPRPQHRRCSGERISLHPYTHRDKEWSFDTRAEHVEWSCLIYASSPSSLRQYGKFPSVKIHGMYVHVHEYSKVLSLAHNFSLLRLVGKCIQMADCSRQTFQRRTKTLDSSRISSRALSGPRLDRPTGSHLTTASERTCAIEERPRNVRS